MSEGVLDAPKHLVVRLPNPLGDAVMATPALRALRSALPSSRITWAGSPAAQAALEGLPYRDGVMPIAGRLARGWRAPLRAGRLLRAIRADAVLLLPNSWSARLATVLARIPVRVGSDLRGGGMLLTRKVRLPRGEKDELLPRSMTKQYLDLAAPFGAVDDGQGIEIRTTAFDEERAAARLEGLAARSLLAVNAGAAFGDTKCYPVKHIVDVVARVRAAHDAMPLILCGPGEEALAVELAERIGDCISTHSRVADIGELKALLARSDVLLTTDAGPRHLAEALGTPTVVWMGPTDPRWSEHSTAHVVRNESLPCLGCHLTTCPIGHPCMEQLEPEHVAHAALAELEGAPAPEISARSS